MDPQDAVEPLVRIAKPLPWDLADFVAYFLLGAVLPATVYMAIEGVPTFLESVKANPIAWSVLGAVFGYPIGVIMNSFGKVLRQLLESWIPDERHKTSYDRLKGQADEIAREVGELVFPKKHLGGEISWYLRVACLIAPNYLPNSVGNLQRQDSFYRHHTTMLAVLTLNAAVLITSAALRLTGALSGQWQPFVGSAVAAVALAIMIEYGTREHNDNILEIQIQIAAALLAVLNEQRRIKSRS